MSGGLTALEAGYITSMGRGSCFIVQELCESRGGRPGLSVLTSLLVSVEVETIEPCFGIGLSLSLICQPTAEDFKQHREKKKAVACVPPAPLLPPPPPYIVQTLSMFGL